MVNPGQSEISPAIAIEFSRRRITTQEAAEEASVSQATFWRWTKGVEPRGAYKKIAQAWLDESRKKPGMSSVAAE